jgi:hypothetical protein
LLPQLKRFLKLALSYANFFEFLAAEDAQPSSESVSTPGLAMAAIGV